MELNEKVERIEERMMEKELYNYQNILEQVKRKKSEDEVRRKVSRQYESALAKEKKQNGESKMIIAENDDGFASCEEEEEEKRSGDPFLDFELDVRKIKEEEPKSKYYRLIFRIHQNFKRGNT